MPLNVRRFYTSIVLVLAGFTAGVIAQTQAINQPSPVPSAGTASTNAAAPIVAAPIKTLTAGEIMRDRISKAKAFIAVRNYNAAIYELEMIRRETSDSSVQAVTNILLMNSYLEQGNYTKAQNFLNEAFKNFKANNANGSMFYSAIAGQAVKGARNQLERYRALGLSVSDRNLPLEAVNDIEKMRQTLELVITQTREAGADKARSAVAMPLLEEAMAARGSLGRDDYDAKRWRDEGTDIREEIASSRSIVINATDGAILPNRTPAIVEPQSNPAPNFALNNQIKPISTPSQGQPQTLPINNKPSDNAVASTTGGPAENTAKQLPAPQPQNAAKADEVKASDIAAQKTPNTSEKANSEPPAATPSGPVEVGSLVEFATAKTQPVYPTAARTMRASGLVKIEVVVDESGEVAEVKNAAGNALLVPAAKDAIRKWKFRPLMRDGQAVRASGFVNFNFTL